MTTPVLEFLRNEAGEKEGLGEAGIETFRDTPYASCAREAGQNSRDAEASLPVRMSFKLLHLERESLPAWSDLFAALRACRDAAEGEKEVDFFDNALRVAAAATVPVLEIADYNTKGLVGPPSEEGTPFHSLLKGTGVSRKESETSGGSFGIGKNASFAVSDLQMVLYSTQYAGDEGGNSNRDSYAAQGKVKLVSHVDGNGVPRRMTGYWGAPGFSAITAMHQIPQWMRRSERGTSIYSIGFRQSSDWAELMTVSLVTHFFAAVHREEMVFEVGGGKYLINRNTIGGLLEDAALQAAADTAGHLSDMLFAGQLYRCLTSPAAEQSTLEIPSLGSASVRVLVDPGLPRRIAFVRNGMFITDNLQHFGHRFARFPGSRDFVALVEPCDVRAQKLLKGLENPAHRELSAQRIPDPTKRREAERAMKTLGKQLRELIKTTTGVQLQGTVLIDELARFFAEPRSSIPRDDGSEANPEVHTFAPPRPNTRSPVSRTNRSGTEGGAAGTNSTGGSGTGGSGVGAGRGSGGRGSRGAASSVQLHDLRNVIRSTTARSGRSRLIHFTPDVDGQISMAVQATGMNDSEPLRVVESDSGTISGGHLTLSVRAGERRSISVTFSESYEGPIEVSATTVPSETSDS